MGLREKVTITLVIIALIQIACRHCMPRTPRKASLKRNLNDLKPVKNNPVPTPYSPSRVNKTPKKTFGKAAQNGRISQSSLPKQSLYKTYNFPENEYPLDNFPRDPFHIGMNFNENNNVNTLQKARNLQSSTISDLKKEMKMKRKLLSNKQVNYGNSQLKTDMSSIKSISNPDPTHLLDSESFPEVQYPLNTMDTWGENHWNYLPFMQEKPFHRFGQQTFNPTAKEDINKPLTRLTKAKASKYLQSYDKLKEEHRRTSTENSKRSNVGQTGLNFTKTATCEKVSDDFMTADLVSNIPSNSTEIKESLTTSVKITTSSENTCPATEYPYHPMPIPNKVIEDNTENICLAHEPKNNTKELQDLDNSEIAQTLQLIQEILFNDDVNSTVSTGNNSKEIEENMNTSDYTVVSANKDISTTLNDSARSCTVAPTEELSQAVSDDAPAGNLQNNMTSLAAELIPENITTVAGQLNVRMPIPFSEPLTYEALTNTHNPGPTPLSNGNAVPGSTSIIIIPVNNNVVGKSQMFGTSPDTSIIVYLPSTQSSDKPLQPSPFNQIVSSLIDRSIPNNQLNNVLSNMAPLQNDIPFSTALVNELLNSNSDSGSSLPIHETLPRNSMFYNNESSPSSMREKPISDILIDKPLTDDAPFIITTSDEKLSEQPIGTGDLFEYTDTLPPISYFEHPLFDFSGSDFTSLSHGPYNNILHDELPIIAREIDSDQQILNVSSKDLFIPTQNITSEHLHKITSMDSVSDDSLSEILNDVPPVALDKNFSSVTSTNIIEILKTKRLLPQSIPNLQEPLDTLTESLPQPIDKILLYTPLIEPPTADLPQPKEASLSPTLLSGTLSDKLPIIMDTKLPLTPGSDTTTDSAPQHIGNSPSPPILNSSPMMTDMTLKTELYKMRQILDKMLFTETPTYSQPPPLDTTLLPNTESDSLLLPINEIHTDNLPLPTTDSPIDNLRQLHENLPPISVDGTPTDILPLSEHKLVIQKKKIETDTPSLPIDEAVPLTPESESFADNKPYVLDNLVTPLSETVTARTKDTSGNGLSQKIDVLPLKMDLKFPNIYEVSSDDLPLSVDELHSKHTTNSRVSTNDLLTQVGETLTPVSEVSVSSLLKTTDMLSLPANEVLKGASSDVPTDSVKTLMSGSIDQLLQDFSSSKVPSDGLPTLPMNVFKLSIHETFPKNNEISFEGPPHKDHLPQLVKNLIPDLSLALTNEPPLKGYSPSLFIDKNIEFPYSTADTKDLPLVVVEHILSPENDLTKDRLVSDIPSGVSLSTNLEGQQSTNLDKTSNEVLSTLPDLPREYLPLPEDKILALTDNKLNDLSLPMNETPSTSKLTITTALLENVLSDITKEGLSSVVAKFPPVTPHSLLDKTLHHVDENSPFSETKDIPVRQVELIFPNSEHTDNLIEYVPFSIKLEDTSIADLPTHDLLVPIDNVSVIKDPYKTLPSSILLITKALLEKENVISGIAKGGLSSAVAKSPLVTPHSLLDKTLHHVDVKSPLSETKDIPLRPVELIFPNSEHTDNLIEYVPLSIKLEDTSITDLPSELSLPMDEMHKDKPYIPTDDIEDHDKNKTQSLDNPIHDLPVPIDNVSLRKDPTKTLSSLKLLITKALLEKENVLSDITKGSFSSVEAKSPPVTPHSLLDKTLHHVDPKVKSPLSETKNIPLRPVELKFANSEHTDNLIEYVPFSIKLEDTSITDFPSELSLPMDEMHKDKPYIPTDDIEDHDKNETQSLDNPIHDLPVPIDNVSLRKDPTKTLSSSKLLITKALLENENVLSDITKRGLTSVEAKSPPVTPHSLLDKTLHHVDVKSPLSETKDIFLRPVELIFPNSEHTDNLIEYVPFYIKLEDTSITDLPSELALPMDEMHKDKPYIPTDDLEDRDKNEIQCLDNPTHDLPVPIDNVYLLKDPTKTLSSSKLLITKALLENENVLSDITKRGLTSVEAKSPPVTPHSLLDKTLHHVDVKSPLSETKDIPLRPVELIFPNSEHTHNLIEYVPFSTKLKDTSITDLPSELSLPMDEMHKDKPYIPTDDIEDHDKNETQSLDNPIHDLPVPIDNVSLRKDPTKTLSSSKLLITKALLENENVLSDITKRGLTSVEAKSPPVTPHSLLDKTLHHVDVKSPLSETKDIALRLVELIFPNSEHSDNLIEYVPFSIKLEDTSITDLPSELSLPMDEMHKDKPYIPTDDIEDIDKNEIQCLDNPTHDLPVPIDNFYLLKDPTKTLSSSQLLITKALLEKENVLSVITKEGLTSLEAKSPPVTPHLLLDKTLHHVDVKSPLSETKDIPLRLVELTFPNSEHSDNLIEYVPFSTKLEDTSITDLPSELSLPMDEMYKDKPYIPTDDIEDHDKNEIPCLDNPTHDLPVPIDNFYLLKNPTKTLYSSKLLTTKALLEKENVLSVITKEGLTSLEAKSPPVTPHLLLDKTLHHVDVKSPLSETKDIPLGPVELIFPNSEHTDNLIEYVPFSTKLEDTSITDLPSELSLPMDEMHKDKPCIPTDDMEDHDKNETQSLDNPTHDLSVPIDNVSLLKYPTKTLSSSKLLITKALLENILSDITTRGFSVPTVQSLPVTSPSVLDKTLYYVESPISHITEDSPSLPVDEIVPNTSLSDNPTDNLPTSNEDTLPLSIDKTYSELQILNIPTEFSSPIDNIRPDIPNISMYDNEQNERENPSSENHTDDLSTATPMEAILSFSKDTPSDLTLPNYKTQSSSKLPITKVLLENVLSDINTRGFSVPVAKALPVAPRSQLDKTLYFLETPASDMTEKSSIIPTGNFPPSGINENVFPRPTDKMLQDNPILDIPTDEVLMDKIHYSDIVFCDVEQEDRSDILTDDVEDTDKSDNMTDKVEDKDTPDNLTDDVEDDNEDKSDIWSKDVEANDKSDNLTDDVEDRDVFDIVTGDVELEDKFDILTDDVEDRVTSDNMTNKVEDRDTSDNLTDDVEDDDEDKSDIWCNDVEANDKSDNLTDNVEDRDIFDIVIGHIELEDKSDILTDDVEDGDKSDNMTDNVEDRATSVNLTDDVEDDNEDKSDIWCNDVEANDKFDNLTDNVEDRHIFDNLTDDVEDENKSGIFSDAVEDTDKSDNMTDKVEDRDTFDNLTDDVEDDNEDFDIWSDDVEANDKSDNLTDDVEDGDIFDNLTDDVEDRDKFDNLTDDKEIEDSNESLFSGDPIDDMPSYTN